MKCIASVLDVEANSVDHAIGARNGGLYGALVVCVGGDLFEVVALNPPRMPRGDAHRGAGLAQIAHDATANKASSPKHGYAAHSLIDPMILDDALDRAVKRSADCLSGLCRRTTFVDMMPDNIEQNLRRGADSLQLFLCFIDQRLSLCVQLLCLFDDRLCPNEKLDQRLARRQRFLDLPKLCIAETGNVTNEVNEPVLQHSLPCRWPCACAERCVACS